jgi:hypothetical protein
LWLISLQAGKIPALPHMIRALVFNPDSLLSDTETSLMDARVLIRHHADGLLPEKVVPAYFSCCLPS